jgi:rod shape-determining protein MreB
MLGRTPGHITAIRPLKDGVIADFSVTEKMLQHFIKKAHGSRYFRPSPRVLVCVPYGSTQVERRAIRESAEGAGARKVYLVEEPMAAAIGAGMPVHEARGSMVLDIGGGTSEVAVISLNGIVYASSVRIGGDRFDDAITNYVRRNYGILIGEGDRPKRIKHEIGSAYPGQDVREISVKGRNLSEGVPRSFTLNSNEILEALQEPLQGIVGAVKGRARANASGAWCRRRGTRDRSDGRRCAPDGYRQVVDRGNRTARRHRRRAAHVRRPRAVAACSSSSTNMDRQPSRWSSGTPRTSAQEDA